MDLHQRLFQHIIKNNLMNRGDVLLVGVSGGADSVCLLDILYRLRLKLGIQLHVAHVNHQLRPTAHRDEQFVKGLSEQLNVPVYIYLCPKNKKGKLISEDTARQWRLKFFIETAKSIGAKSIVLAHTQNDQAETILMRLIRGTGLVGLRGILVEHDMEQVKFVRPFLSVSRQEIEGYLRQNKLKFCQDETNLKMDYLRNKIRIKLLPELVKEYNNQLPKVLLDLAAVSNDDYDFLLREATKAFEKNAVVHKGRIRIKLKSFLKEHISIKRMILRIAYERLSSHLNGLTFAHIQEVEDMILNRPINSDVHWPQGFRVIKLKDFLEIRQG